jgi:UDP-N-acetylmuramoylalanine--D-glutamate ligase
MIPILAILVRRHTVVLGLGRSGLATARALRRRPPIGLRLGRQCPATRDAAADLGFAASPIPVTIDWSGIDRPGDEPRHPHHPPGAASRGGRGACRGQADHRRHRAAGRAPARQARFVGITGTNGKSTTTA